MPRTKIKIDLPVSILKEGDAFIAYSPALEVTTVGKTFREAQKRFNEAVNIFFEEIIANNTFEEALLELGWQKRNKRLSPPMVISTHIEPFSFDQSNIRCYA